MLRCSAYYASYEDAPTEPEGPLPLCYVDREPGQAHDGARHRQGSLHDAGPVVAWCELSDGQLRTSSKPCWMINRVDVDRGTSEKTRAQCGNHQEPHAVNLPPEGPSTLLSNAMR
jgi:hypothetical protein